VTEAALVTATAAVVSFVLFCLVLWAGVRRRPTWGETAIFLAMSAGRELANWAAHL
jgi:hypothetical protein